MTTEVVGSGDIARVLRDVDKDALFFASGVSNSQETDEAQYQREKDLLLSQDRSKRLVYFGSLAIFYNPGTRYSQHKREMEELVKDNFDRYCIVRIGTITWGENPNTIINYLRNRYRQGEPLVIQDVERYVIDQDELVHWLNMIPDFNCELTITGRRMKVADIVKEYVLE